MGACSAIARTICAAVSSGAARQGLRSLLATSSRLTKVPRFANSAFIFEYLMYHLSDELMFRKPEEQDIMIRTGGARSIYAGEVNRWIEFAVNRNARILDLDFTASGSLSVTKYEADFIFKKRL